MKFNQAVFYEKTASIFSVIYNTNAKTMTFKLPFKLIKWYNDTE